MLADLEGVNHSYDSSSSGFDLPHPLPVWWRKGRLAMVEEGRGIFDQCWRGVKEERNAGREQRTVIEGNDFIIVTRITNSLDASYAEHAT